MIDNTQVKPESFDSLQRFVFNDYAIRGVLVQSDSACHTLLALHQYPECVADLLAQMQVAICLITSTLKFEGEIMLQLRSQGALKYAIVNSNHRQETRGLACVEGTLAPDTSFADLVANNGIMTISVIPEHGQQYQGIIALEKPTLAECIQDYYTQSMQIPTTVQLFSCASMQLGAGLLLQVLPTKKKEQQALDFEHVNTLANTVTTAEMLSLDSQDIIYRLFNQESVNIFPNEPICFKCTCSHEHFAHMLMQMGADALLKLYQEDHQIETQCHYCGQKYHFSESDIIALIKKSREASAQHDLDHHQ